MKIAICNELFENWELENTISYCADLGYDGIEIAPFTLDEWPNELPERRREALRIFAENHKIDVVGLHWLLAGPKGLSISSPDKEIRNFTRDYLLDLIDLCADLGGKILVFGSPAQRTIGKHQTFQEVWTYAVEIFKACMERTAARDVTLCIEPLSIHETNFINTASEAIRLIKAINHPNFQLHLDVKAMSFEKKSIPDIIKNSADFLHHFHVNDPNGHEPGFNNFDFAPILEALHEINYQRFISVEVFNFKDGAEKIANRAYSYLGQII